MTKLKTMPLLAISGFVISLFPLSAQAANGILTSDKAAMCATALDLKKEESGLPIQEMVAYGDASKWFAKTGQDINKTAYANEARQYNQALRHARESGDPQYGRAVSGCLAHYQSRQHH